MFRSLDEHETGRRRCNERAAYSTSVDIISRIRSCSTTTFLSLSFRLSSRVTTALNARTATTRGIPWIVEPRQEAFGLTSYERVYLSHLIKDLHQNPTRLGKTPHIFFESFYINGGCDLLRAGGY